MREIKIDAFIVSIDATHTSVDIKLESEIWNPYLHKHTYTQTAHRYILLP